MVLQKLQFGWSHPSIATFGKTKRATPVVEMLRPFFGRLTTFSPCVEPLLGLFCGETSRSVQLKWPKHGDSIRNLREP